MIEAWEGPRWVDGTGKKTRSESFVEEYFRRWVGKGLEGNKEEELAYLCAHKRERWLVILSNEMVHMTPPYQNSVLGFGF